MKLRFQSRKPSGRNLFHIIFSADHEAALYKTPGQYVTMSRGSSESFFALSSAPNGNDLEFLVKNDGGIARILCEDAQPDIECSAPQGSGFPLETAVGRPVHLFSMGSGIGPFRALIQHRKRGRFSSGPVTLWQGSFTRESLPFAEEYDAWRASGIDVRVCLDRDSGPDAGNIVDHLRREKMDMSTAVGYWIGSREFGEAVGALAADRGLPPERFITNF